MSQGKYCVASGCHEREYKIIDGKRYKTDRSFFRFPSDRAKIILWCSLIRRTHGTDEFTVSKNSVVCDLHFDPASIRQTPCSKRKTLMNDALPKLHRWNNWGNTITEPSSFQIDVQHESLSESTKAGNPPVESSSTSVCRALFQRPAASRDTLDNDIELELLKKQVIRLQQEKLELIAENKRLRENLALRNHQIEFTYKENLKLKDELNQITKSNTDLKNEMSEMKKSAYGGDEDEQFVAHVVASDENCRHYTGFPSVQMLYNTYEYLDPGPNGEHVVMYNPTTNSQPKNPGETRGRKRALAPFKSYLLLLCRCRRNFSIEHLAWLVRGTASTVSTVIITWLNFMYLRFAMIPIWPTREIVEKHRPESMKVKFPNVRAIIDCFEIFTEVPSSLTLYKAMYSTYKAHTTVKCLVAIAPGGGFSFVSALFSGNTSDKEMVARSGLLDQRLWEQGDECMADRGFTVADLFEPIGVRLVLPSFLNGQEQLSVKDTVTSQQIAAERVHVERQIQLLKCFQIFNQPIPLKMVGSANQLVTVCAILCNLHDPILAKKS